MHDVEPERGLQGTPGALQRQLAGKRAVLGVCGGIAAYKAVEVCRRLGEEGALVTPVLTESATRFVGALTFSAVSAAPAQVSLFAPEGATSTTGGPTPHLALARWADAVVVVPATARLIGSYAAGISSDLLTATLLATRAPVLLCPAMHTEMWDHPAVRDNVALLRRRGVVVLEPDDGPLSGGDSGKGRLPSPEAVLVAVRSLLAPALRPLQGVNAVVSAGGTVEAIDPVRYIGNRSSGKQGYAVAAELAGRGAHVTLVTSSCLEAPAGTEVVKVQSAAEMAEAVLSAAAAAQVVVMAAAVADYRPATVAPTKVKKSALPLHLDLVPTVDILAELGARRRPGQVLVGFAAETASGDELARLGRAKLLAKMVDLVVANEVGREGFGFGEDSSSAVIVARESTEVLGLLGKQDVARLLADRVEAFLGASGLSEASEQAHVPDHDGGAEQ